MQRLIDASLKALQAQLVEIDRTTCDTVSGSPVWQAEEDLLTSLPGIGDITARTLIADLPELSRLDRRRTAALVGVAPIIRDPGLMRGHQAIVGGHLLVCNILYMATLVLAPWNPIIKDHYQRLVACMQRLLTILNAIIRNNSPWQNA